MVGRGVDLETAVAVKDLALRMGNAAVYKEGGIAGEDYPNHLKLTDVDEVSTELHPGVHVSRLTVFLRPSEAILNPWLSNLRLPMYPILICLLCPFVPASMCRILSFLLVLSWCIFASLFRSERFKAKLSYVG